MSGEDMKGIAGKVVFITGAASGIGAATARLAAAEGAVVVLADRDTRGAEVAASIGPAAEFLELDVSSEPSWQAAFAHVEQRFGRLDVLVNAAGINPSTTIVDTSIEDWRRAFSVNADGVFLGCKHGVTLMTAKGTAGAIVNVASPMGIKPWATLIAYSASKAAVLNLTNSVALFCVQENNGIRCNAVVPGAVHTAMMERYLQSTPDPAAALAGLAANQPGGRLVTAEEVAEAILYMAGGGSASVTGAVLPVDGGSHLR
jgi:3(or 17)beta-hydroxysteroid dehydrogenase